MPTQHVLLFDGTACSEPTKTNVELLREALGFEVEKLRVKVMVASGTELDRYKLADGTIRSVLYQEGLGAPRLVKTDKGDSLDWSSYFTKLYTKIMQALGLLPELLNQLEAFGIVDNIKHAYRYLAKHYKPGDQIFLSGFSRGAYTLRLLLGMIRDIGLLDATKFSNEAELEQAIEQIFALYNEESNPATNPKAKQFSEKCHPSKGLINFAGLFDSVSGPIVDEVHKNARLGDCVQVFRHAVALNEEREEFAVELVIPDGCSNFAQEWFPGSHGDVGGGSTDGNHGLSNGPLHWIAQAANACGLGLDPKSIEQYLPNPLAIRHDSRAEEIVLGVKWAEVTTHCKRQPLRRTYERFHQSVIQRYGKSDLIDVSDSSKLYMPSNVNQAIATMKTAFELFTAERGDRFDDSEDEEQSPAKPISVRDLFDKLPDPDEWSDAEDPDPDDADQETPRFPSLIPRLARI